MKKEITVDETGEVILKYSKQESKGVLRSIEQLKKDIEKVVNCRCTMLADVEEDKLNRKDEGFEKARISQRSRENQIRLYIVAGTIGKNKIIDRKIKEGILKTDTILDDSGKYRWEGYIMQEAEGVLYIAGADRRGTIFGVYEFSRWMGVSPWYYFGDVPVKKRELHMPVGFYRADYPSVQYRGIFINDEEELEAWARKHTKDKTIGPCLYEKIFELLLRLKANYIWPAMHVNYFNENPRNGELAEEMGIVVGTSHCDMLLRSNQNEWRPWIEKKGYYDLAYDYSIEGENRERLKEYWRESLEINRDYENTYTMGMRGIHDYGFITKKIDEDGALNEEERLKEKIKLMETIFNEQRDIMRQVLGEKKEKDAVKVFIPYKEVLDLYDGGLHVPEDVTLMWVDDNFGHMRRYPNKEEAARKGGCGLYFHNSYWAHPEMSYLFINSIPLAQTGNELEKSYEKGIRKIWVLNVGAIKPLEMDIEYFIRYAFEAGKEESVTRQPDRFVQEWIDFNFSGEIGSKAADIYREYAQLTNVRKVEHMVSEVFEQEGYGDEAGRRMVCLKKLYDRGNKIMLSMPEDEREAFFEMFLMKIHASFYCNGEYYFADRSRLSYKRGLGSAADKYIGYSRIMMDCRRQMLYFYNKIMCNGKWEDILTPEAFPPPGLPLYPTGKPALIIDEAPLMSVVTWDGIQTGQSGELIFYKSGIGRKWIEIGNLGGGEVEYKICGHENTWLILSETEGKIREEKRIYISASKEWGDISDDVLLEIYEKNTGEKKQLWVRKNNDIGECKEKPAAFEADGGVTINADSFKEAENIKIIPGLGRMNGAAVMALPKAGKEAKLEYVFYTFSQGTYEAEIQRYVTLNSKGKIRMEVKLDDMAPEFIESLATDEWKKGWKESILNNGEKLSCVWRGQMKGRHTLTITIPDEFVTIDKITIYTAPRKKNNLGIPNVGENGEYPEDWLEINWACLKSQTEELYGIGQKELPLPKQVYAGKDFWKIDRLYALNEEYEQNKRGAERNYYDINKGGKNVLNKIANMDFYEKNGRLGIEAECALAQTKKAWITTASSGICSWEHLQAETAGGTGLAMQTEPAGISFDNPYDAPWLNYKISIKEKGNYHVWILMYVPDSSSDMLALALDGNIQPVEKQFSHGGQFTYGTSHIYYWNLLSDIELTKEEHILSIIPIKTGFRVDRIYLTRGDELPPDDGGWDEVTE